MNAWCYLYYYFIPSVVGKCTWVLPIQRRSKIRSLATPSDKAFCLLVLKNSWDLWAWECTNPGVSLPFKLENAPHVLYTSTKSGRRTEIHGGWSQDGISLYNTLVNELTINRRNLDTDMVEIGSNVKKSRMEILED